MNFFGMGASELVVIFIIMLIVAGPKRMVVWAYTLGQWMAKLREIWGEVVALVQKEIDAAGLDVEVPKDIPTRQNLNKMAQDALKPLSKPLEDTADEIRKAGQDLKQAGTSARLEVKNTWAQADAMSRKASPPQTPPAQGFGTWATPTPKPPADDSPPEEQS